MIGQDPEHNGRDDNVIDLAAERKKQKTLGRKNKADSKNKKPIKLNVKWFNYLQFFAFIAFFAYLVQTCRH